jgi:16S rRNA processing protein RimM
MDPAAFVPLGRIVKTHGLAGEVSVIQTGRLPLEHAQGLTVWFVPPTSSVRSAVIESVRQGPKGPLVRLSGVCDPTTADSLRGASMVMSESDLPEGLPDEEPDPLGLRVHDAERGDLGAVDDVIVTGANDVWVVRGGPYGEVLIPVIDEVVVDIDYDAMTAQVRLLPGLMKDE